MQWTMEEVAGALRVAIPAGLHPLARVAGVSIDSRTVVRGQLFVAISGPRHDGHAFVAGALELGAVAAIVAREKLAGYPDAIRGNLFGVADTVVALQELAREARRRWGRRIAAVTGSVGKTTTKEILATLLAAKWRVLKSEGNLNNEYGLPLTLLRLDAADQAAVVELGMSHRGELRRLAEIAEPEVGVVTRVAPVHLEYFASIDEIALAKRELIEGLCGPDPVAVLNADDPRVAKFREVARGRVVTFGFSPEADFRAENIEDRGLEGSEFNLISPEGRRSLWLPLPGRHSVSNALAALAAAYEWGIRGEDAAAVFPTLAAGEMRGRLLRFAEGFAVINDSYNSNPVALAAMAEILARTPGYKRRILVAGQMLELGPESAHLHVEAGKRAAELKIDCVVGVQGDAARDRGRAAAAASVPAASQTHFFADSAQAAAFLADLVRPGDLLLVKGSRGVKMERIVEALRAETSARRRRHAGFQPAEQRRSLKCSTFLAMHSTPRLMHLLNVFRYITVRTAMASLSGLFLGLVLGPWVIQRLRDLQISQFIREEGPRSHQAKAGTPTMGGILIVAATLIPTLLWADLSNPNVLLACFAMLGFGGVGFIDDYSKVTRRQNLGLSGRSKLGLQILVSLAAGVALLLMMVYGVYSTELIVPFFKRFHPDLVITSFLPHPYLRLFAFLPFLIFVTLVMVGSSNAVNLTDGLDGLAIGCTVIAAGALTVLTYITSHARFSAYLDIQHLPDVGELTVFGGALMGASLAFLWYNAHPADVFMGDVGSLALGGSIGLIAVAIKQEILLFSVGGIFVVEALSVILQVASFRLTGKRIFRMSPLHHHFELAGWSESKIIVRFWIVALIFALFSLTTLKLR